MVSKPAVVGTLPHQSSRHARLFPILLLITAVLLFGAATFYHYVVYLPQPKQPHRLTIVDDFFALGVVIVVIIVGLALGRRLLRAFHVQGLTRLEHSILALGLGWGLLSLGVLVVGIAHLLFTWTLAAGMVLIMLLSWREVWQMLTNITTISWYAPLNAIRPRSLLERVLVLILAIQVVLACTQALTLPIYPRGWDLYSYHWAVPQEFLFHHAIYAVPGWASADFPINSEMLNVLALAVGSPIAALMIQMVFGIAMVLLIAGFLYRRYGSLAAWLGVLLCMTSPLFIAYLTSGYVEPATAYYGVATLVIVLLWIDFQRQEEAPQKWRLPLLAGIFSGLGVGAKYQAGMVVVGVVLLFAVAGGLRVVVAWRDHAKRRKIPGRFASGTVLYLGGTLIALLPWLLKDWILLGNPIYPFIWGGPGWNESRTLTGSEQITHFGPVGSLAERLIEAFFQFFGDNGRTDDSPFLPLNYLLLLAPLLLPVAALRLWKKWPQWKAINRSKVEQGLAWLVVVAGGYISWVVSHTTHDRYAMSWVMLLVVPAAILLAGIVRASVNQRVLHPILQSLIILLLLLGPFYSLSFWSETHPLSLLLGQVSLRQWEHDHLLRTAGYWEMVDYVNERLPHESKLLLIGANGGYFIQDHDYVDDTDGDWVPYLVTAGKTPAGFVTLLRQQGFSYLAFEEQTLEYNARVYGAYTIGTNLPVFHQFLAQSLVLVRVFDAFSLYRIPET